MTKRTNSVLVKPDEQSISQQESIETLNGMRAKTEMKHFIEIGMDEI